MQYVESGLNHLKLARNFYLEEFSCKDGTVTPVRFIPSLSVVADSLQVLRDELNSPIYINSGYRTVDHNKIVGGSKNSFHLMGMAVDISSRQYHPGELFMHLKMLMAKGMIKKGGLGLYPTFVHYDIRGYKLVFKSK